jgi:hypothetical protein
MTDSQHSGFAARCSRPTGRSLDRADCRDRHFEVRAESGRVSPTARWAAMEWRARIDERRRDRHQSAVVHLGFRSFLP